MHGKRATVSKEILIIKLPFPHSNLKKRIKCWWMKISQWMTRYACNRRKPRISFKFSSMRKYVQFKLLHSEMRWLLQIKLAKQFRNQKFCGESCVKFIVTNRMEMLMQLITSSDKRFGKNFRLRVADKIENLHINFHSA